MALAAVGAMQSNKHLTDALERVRAFEGPVLSMYFDVDTARGRTPAELEMRAKSTVDGLDVSDEVEQLVLKTVVGSPPRTPVVGVFVEQDTLDVDVVPIPVALPVEDPRTGRGAARIGPPYVEPIIAAIDATAAYVVLYADRDKWRLFTATQVEIEQVDHDDRSPTPGELDRIQNSKQEHPQYVADRGASAQDHIQDHLDNARDRFFRSAIARLEALYGSAEFEGLLLLGPEEDLAALEALMPPPLANEVVSKQGGLPDPKGNEAHVLEQITPTLEAAQRHRKKQLLDSIARHGVVGLGPCLEAWQVGNLAEVALPLSSETVVFLEPESGYVAASREGARRHHPDRAVDKVRLGDVVDQLAQRFDVRLTYVHDDLAERLKRELEGIGGRPRW